MKSLATLTSLNAQAATNAAPRAVQVAVRRHLLHNVTEAPFKALARHHQAQRTYQPLRSVLIGSGYPKDTSPRQNRRECSSELQVPAPCHFLN